MQLEKLKEKGELSSFEIVLLDSKTDGTELHEEVINKKISDEYMNDL